MDWKERDLFNGEEKGWRAKTETTGEEWQQREGEMDSSSIWKGTKQKELTNEWNQTKGGEGLD